MAQADTWAAQFKEVTDSDPEINAHGKYYSCSFLLDMADRKVIVDMHGGKVEQVNLDVQPLDHYQFSLRAPADTWRKMAVETPEPMYHGIWAASFRKGLTMEGDLLVLMQNLRCFTRHMELLRQTGVPV